jgi:hypothetical protein
MGAEPYFYFTRYQPDLSAALEELRQREFAAGRYNPAMPFLQFPIDPNVATPGAQHDSIEEAFADAEADGTRSILDLMSISEEPDFCAAAPLPESVLTGLYGTTRPTREMILENMGFFEHIDRGQGIYIIVYKDDAPNEIFFAGYSFD